MQQRTHTHNIVAHSCCGHSGSIKTHFSLIKKRRTMSTTRRLLPAIAIAAGFSVAVLWLCCAVSSVGCRTQIGHERLAACAGNSRFMLVSHTFCAYILHKNGHTPMYAKCAHYLHVCERVVAPRKIRPHFATTVRSDKCINISSPNVHTASSIDISVSGQLWPTIAATPVAAQHCVRLPVCVCV